MKKGFTLIELLVVVLIIGILASIALPQYQKAVGKARMAELKTILPTLRDAIHVAHLETGENFPPLDSLSVDLPELENWNIQYDECINDNGYWGCSLEFDGKGKMEDYFVRYVEREYHLANGTESYPFGWICFHNSDSSLCKNLGFTKYFDEWDGYIEP